MLYTLFHLGPYKICFWNLLLLAFIVSSAVVLRYVIHKNLKNYLIGANVKIEGRKVTGLNLLSQSIYILAFYIAVRSLNINNEDVSFTDFWNAKLIESKVFTLSFNQILVIVALFFGAKIFLNLYKLYINRRFFISNQNRGSEYVYIQVAKYITYIFVLVIAFKVLEINVSIFLTGSAALLVGLGLGLQDVFKDVFSGTVLLFEGTLKVGDIIELRDSSTGIPLVCKILKINVRTTLIETKDGNILIVPNAKLTQEYVENWSMGSSNTMHRIDVQVAYGTDGKIVSDLLIQAANAHPKVKKELAIEVRLTDFGQDGMRLALFFWAENSWEIDSYKSEIRFEINRLFTKYHIEIPYQQRVMHIREQ